MSDLTVVDPRRRKLTLFCQACGFASPIDGEWKTETRPSGTVRYRCPDCDHVVLVRRATGDDGEP